MVTRRQRFWKEWRGFILMMVAMLSFRAAWADWYKVPSASMQPNLIEGDRILVDKHDFGLRIPFLDTPILQWGEPARGDVVVFIEPESGIRMVKRVVGVAGDSVELRSNGLWLNGQPARYDMIAKAPDKREFLESIAGRTRGIQLIRRYGAREQFGPFTVPEGQIFVMGDNRNNSLDSRYYGAVPVSAVIGRATRVIASLDPGDHYLPRSDRFWQVLR